MAELYRDGFEWITGNTQINLQYQDCPTLTLTKTDDTTGRVTIPGTATKYGKALSVTGGTGAIATPAQVHFCRSLTGNPDVVFMGAGILDTCQAAQHVGYFMFRDGSTDQIVIGRGADWSIVVCRGNGRTGADNHLLVLTELGRSSAGAVPANAWFHLEAKILFTTDATGTVEVRVNEQVVLTLVNKETCASDNAQCTAAGIGREHWYSIDGDATGDPTDETVIYVDDLYIRDDAGAANNDFAGDCVVTDDVPSGAGTYTQFSTVYGSATHWGAVDDSGFHDGDTSYIETATVGHIDSFTKAANAFSTGTVHSVAVVAVARKSGAGARQIESLLRLSTTDANGSHVSLGDSYEAHQFIHETDPAGNTWTLANLNAVEIGVAVAA